MICECAKIDCCLLWGSVWSFWSRLGVVYRHSVKLDELMCKEESNKASPKVSSCENHGIGGILVLEGAGEEAV